MMQNESWLPWLIRAVGPFGLYAMLAALALGIAGLAMCLAMRHRKTWFVYLLLAQLPLLLCLVGVARNWLIVNAVARDSDVVLQSNEWADVGKETTAMLVWGFGWTVPLEMLALVGLRLCHGHGEQNGHACCGGADCCSDD